MKKSIIALLGLAVILGGCSNKVSYGDSQATETTTIDFGSTDLQKNCWRDGRQHDDVRFSSSNNS